ncbi:hypothetical protein ATPR_2208 [Acetobacter tropicalis NBRC 101654]|uniref:Uncharacterized protein n=1 Tax=Acetobacter tropicalis NBRC 101654 TaxID=749388 RepID=F7VFR0_9PROT|nr:hypothetical protein ATPR_2208 [Acetobacter tropicalis NBRC 101654]
MHPAPSELARQEETRAAWKKVLAYTPAGMKPQLRAVPFSGRLNGFDKT